MSQFVLYLHLEPFVSQWLVHSYGSPVRFPAQSVENATIRRFLTKQPEGVPMIEEQGTAICIPYSKAKPPIVYNYLGKHGRAAVVECIEDNFNRCLWSEMCDANFNVLPLMIAIYAWCELHGINIDHAHTIRQRFYRMRDAYKRRGIDFMRRWKQKDQIDPDLTKYN